MNDEHEPQAVPSGTIVVGIDAHESWRNAVDWAADQARVEGRALTLVHVADAELWRDPAGRETRIGVAQTAPASTRVLDEARQRVAARAPGVPVYTVWRAGGVTDGLREIAQHAHLLVVGGRHHSVWSRLLGTVESAVTRRPPCPVVVAPFTNPGLVHRGVLVGVDDTEHSQAALRFGFEEASLRGWPLTVVHVALAPVYGEPTDDPDEHRHLAEAIAGLAETYPDVHVRTAVERGERASVVLRMSRQMNLVVLGAHHGATISDLLLGSTVTPVVNEAACPVAVVPEESADRRVS